MLLEKERREKEQLKGVLDEFESSLADIAGEIQKLICARAIDAPEERSDTHTDRNKDTQKKWHPNVH